MADQDYKAKAKKEFEELKAKRGERATLTVVAGRYLVSEQTMCTWVGIDPKKIEHLVKPPRPSPKRAMTGGRDADDQDPGLFD
jgi:hypothetical protein